MSMSKISSTLELIDRTSKTIQKSIDSINRITKAMDKANRTAADVDIGTPMLRGATAAERSAKQINQLDKEVQKLEKTAFVKLPKEIDKIRQAALKSEKQIQNLENKLNNLNTSGFNAPKLNSGLGGFSKAVLVANQGLQLLKSTMGSLGSATEIIDTRAMADARLSLILDDNHTQEQLEQQVMAVSNAVGAEYDTTADLIAKVGRQDYFKGNNNMATRFADVVNKSFVVSGTSASEMDGAIRQLTQGLASDTLRGDEFNSVMENAPVLSEMIAESLDMTKGELREVASKGVLTAEVVASAILENGEKIDEMFEKMPVTFERLANVAKNHISNIAKVLQEPDMAFGRLNKKLQEFIKWLDTAEGMEFQGNIVAGINTIVEALMWTMDLVADIYNFVADNWSWIAPVIIGITIVVIGLNIAYGLLAVIITAVSIAEGIKKSAQSKATIATVAATNAQHGLNAAMYACPVTWIIGVIMIIITALLAAAAVLTYLWKTNLAFRIGVVEIWNNILNFFDKIPLFFWLLVNAVIDIFSWLRNRSLQTAENMCNGVIDYINQMIKSLNAIPGVEIQAIEKIQLVAKSEMFDEAIREARLQDYNAKVKTVEDKARERAEKLEADKSVWAEEIAKNNAFLDKIKNLTNVDLNDYLRDFDTPVNSYVTGGGLDKEIDISSASLDYLNDIAERQALIQFEELNAQMELVTEDAQMSDEDRKLIMETAGAKQIVYYLDYKGGVNMNNSINKGEDWETIKRQLAQETQSEIDIGISDLEEVIMT